MEIKIQKNARYLILAFFGVILSCSSFLIYSYNPLQLILKKLTALKAGSLLYTLWLEPPYEVLIRCYMFNITNSAQFLNGDENLKLEEVGPYSYREVLTNENSIFNENGTVTFDPKRMLVKSLEHSINDPALDTIQTVNIPLLGISSLVTDLSMFINLGIAGISRSIGSEPILTNISVEKYLWGYEDKLVTMANTFIPSWINFDKFGILDRIMALDNGNNTVTIMVDPDKKTSSNNVIPENERKQLFHIQRFNGSPGLKQWGFKETEANETNPNCMCNTIEGSYEGGIFPPNIQPNTSFRVYRRAFCRPVLLNYDEEIETKEGYKAYIYRIDKNFLETPDVNPDNACYCYKGKCPVRGLGHITPCYYNIPIMISQPHFYNGDPSLSNKIDGMKPDREKHDSTFVLFPEVGLPLAGSLRIQINLQMPKKTKYNPKIKPFDDMVIPLFWLELYVEDAPSIVHLLIKAFFVYLPVAQTICIYLFAILGISMIGTSGLLVFYFPQSVFHDPFLNIDYSPIRIVPMTAHFKPHLRISK